MVETNNNIKKKKRRWWFPYDKDRFPTFENYLYNVHCALVDDWVESVKELPEGTRIGDIPEAMEKLEDIHRFEFFCKKYLGYEQYPKGNDKAYEFHYVGDDEDMVLDEEKLKEIVESEEWMKENERED